MFLFFVSIIGYAIQCVSPTLQCQPMSIGELSILVLAGVVELKFEIAGIIKIYKSKTDGDDDSNPE